MRTRIQKPFEAPVFLTMNEHRLPTKISCKIVTRFLNLTFMTEKNPIGFKNRFELRLKNLWVEIYVAVDAKDAVSGPIINHICNADIAR